MGPSKLSLCLRLSQLITKLLTEATEASRPVVSGYEDVQDTDRCFIHLDDHEKAAINKAEVDSGLATAYAMKMHFDVTGKEYKDDQGETGTEDAE